MDRVRSAPAAVAMGRSISSTGTTSQLQRCSSSLSNPCDELSTDYTFSSGSASVRRQSSLQPIVETSPFSNEGMVEYTPEQYITTCIEPSGSPSLSLSQPQNPRQLHVQLTPTAQWSPSLDDSTSPSTPSTALMTPVTQAGNTMSRQCSLNPFFDDVSMLRVQSDASSFFTVLSEDGAFSFLSDVDEKSISNCVDNPPFLNFTGPPSESFLCPAPVSASVSALASSEHKNMRDLAEDMRRSASASSESDASNASASSTSTRQSRREREIAAQASRKIAPKAVASNDETKSASSNVSMVRIRSEDGSSKNVGVISKAPYVRPQHPKIMCPHCNERREGFRGTHELERHVQRAHVAVRKGYICIDASPDKKFLANCKHCRNKKTYGAYYNAAAHLRRAHFHPRKRGRKGKHDEKRGGIGGGDDPPMDYLKQNWIREVEVQNKQIIGQSPDSASEGAEPSFDATHDVDSAYSSQSSLPQPPTTDVSMSIDTTNQYIDYSMCMTESEPMYDPRIVYTNEPNNTSTGDISNFQFDAYMA